MSEWNDMGFVPVENDAGIVHGAGRVIILDNDEEFPLRSGSVQVKHGLKPLSAIDMLDLLRPPTVLTSQFSTTIKARVEEEIYRQMVERAVDGKRHAYKLSMSFDHGEPDPFWNMPEDAHTWRGAWNWIKSIFSYWWRDSIKGVVIHPKRITYTFNDLMLVNAGEPPLEMRIDPYYGLVKQKRDTLEFRGDY